jgi:hypothetical protein
LAELREEFDTGEEWHPVEELKKNVKGALKVAAEVPQNLYNLATNPSSYLKELMARQTPERLGQVISGGFGPGNIGGLAGTIRPVKGSKVLPAAEREANLQAMQAKSAAPGDWFHGTSRDITQFKPKQAGATFLTRDPKFAEGFAEYSNDWMAKNAKDILTPEQLAAAKPKAIAEVKEAYLDTMPEHQEILINAIKNYDPMYPDASSKYFSGEALDFLHKAYKEQLPSGPNILKVHAAVENPWDYANPEHLDAVAAELNKRTDSYGQPLGNKMKPWLKTGQWPEVERPEVQDAIRALGHDAFYTKEGSVKNLGVYDPAKIKSAYGNEGTYDLTNPEINKKAGGSVKLPRYSKQHRARQYAAEKR